MKNNSGSYIEGPRPGIDKTRSSQENWGGCSREGWPMVSEGWHRSSREGARE